MQKSKHGSGVLMVLDNIDEEDYSPEGEEIGDAIVLDEEGTRQETLPASLQETMEI